MSISFCTYWVQKCVFFVMLKILKTAIYKMEGLAHSGHKI